MKRNQIALALVAAAALIAPQPAQAQTGGFIVGNPQATVRGGASQNVDIVEGGGSGTASGTISVKYSATLDTARKHYVKFDLTGHNPNTNGPLYVRYDTAANSQRQDVQVWSLDQDYPGMASTITWNTAQANDTNSGSGLVTSGPFTATAYQKFLSATTANTLDATHALHGPWGHMIRSGNVIHLVLSSVNNIGDNGLRFVANSVELGFDDLTSGAPPSLSALPDLTVVQGQNSATNAFTVGDPEDGPNALAPVAVSSNEGVIPSANIFFGGTGANRTMYLMGGAAVGTATVTVSVVDVHGNQATRAISVTNVQQNLPPVIVAGGATNSIPPTNTLVNTAVTIPFAVSDAESPNSTLVVTPSIAAYSGAILASATLVGAGPNTDLSVVVTPQAGADGVGVVQISCSDPDGNVNHQSFCVMVRPSSKVVFVDHFDYNGSNTRLTDDAPNLWTRRNASAQSVILRSGTDPITLNKVAWLRPNAGAEDLGAPLIGGPYSPASRAVLYTKFNVAFADQAAGGPGINVISNGEGAFFRLSTAGTSTTDFMDYLSVSTNGVSDPATEFRVFIANGTDTSTPWPVNFTKPINLATETAMTLITRYDVVAGKATLWVNGTKESDAWVTGTGEQIPASVGYVGLFQERGNGDLYVDDLTVTVLIKPLITVVAQPAAGSIEFDFAAGASDAASDFTVERASTVEGTYANQSAAITALGGGNFRATVGTSGSLSFYKVKRNSITF